MKKEHIQSLENKPPSSFQQSFLAKAQVVIPDYLQCEGCGVELQTDDSSQLGYIPLQKLRKILSLRESKQEDLPQKEEIKEIEGIENLETEYKDYTQIDIDLYEKMEKAAPLIHQSVKYAHFQKQNKKLTCSRCHRLVHYRSVSTIHSQSSLAQQDFIKRKDLAKSKTLAELAEKNAQPEYIVQKLKQTIPQKQRVVLVNVMDITDFEATYIKELIHYARQRDHFLVYVVTKQDLLPKGATKDSLQKWCRARLNALAKENGVEEGKVKDYLCILSGKHKNSFSQILNVIKRLKGVHYETEQRRLKVFVVGCANSGKSTFINTLYRSVAKYEKAEKRTVHKFPMNEFAEEWKDPQEDADYEDETIEGEDQKPFSQLTESPLPGTTLDIVKVKKNLMSVRIYDTPGIPNPSQMTSHVKDPHSLLNVVPTKRIVPYSIRVRPGQCVWLGALARIDLLNGNEQSFTFFRSMDVTVHRTQTLNGWKLFQNHKGDILRPSLNVLSDMQEKKEMAEEWEQRQFSIVLESTRHKKTGRIQSAFCDIVIHGLGWFAISGRGFVQIMVTVPKGVDVSLRDKPLMPHQIQNNGLQRFGGKTEGGKTRRALKLKERNKLLRDQKEELQKWKDKQEEQK